MSHLYRTNGDNSCVVSWTFLREKTTPRTTTEVISRDVREDFVQSSGNIYLRVTKINCVAKIPTMSNFAKYLQTYHRVVGHQPNLKMYTVKFKIIGDFWHIYGAIYIWLQISYERTHTEMFFYITTFNNSNSNTIEQVPLAACSRCVLSLR